MLAKRLAMLGCAVSMCSFHSPTLERPRWQCGQLMEAAGMGNASESLLLPFSGLCCGGCCRPSAWSAKKERDEREVMFS